VPDEPLEGRTILLVEDDRALQRALAEALSDAGFTVLAERDGEWAVRTFRQRPVDLAVVDVLLPGKSGLAVADEIRHSPRGVKIPIVMSTGLVRNETSRRDLADKLGGTGPLEWLDKPYEPGLLVSVCQRLLHLTPEETDPAERKKRRARETEASRSKPDLGSDDDVQEAKGVESESQIRFHGAALVRGNLSETPFAEVLSQLHRWRATGALLLRNQTMKKIVYVKEGAPLFVRSNLLSECLGQVLVRERMITHDECTESLERMQAEKRQQGTVLIEMGCISPANLAYALQLQQETKLYDLFAWPSGEYNFNPRAEAPPSQVALEGTSARILFEGIQRTYEEGRAARELGEIAQIGSMRIRLSDEPLDRFQEMGLEADHARFYSLIDGRRMIKDLLAPGGLLPLDEGQKLLYALKCANMIQLVPPGRAQNATAEFVERGQRPASNPRVAGIAEVPAFPNVPPPPVSAMPERALLGPELILRQQIELLAARAQDLRRGTLYEALGIKPDATLRDLESAFSSKAREHHPNRLGPDTSAETRGLAEEIFSLLIHAHETLADPVRRTVYDANMSQGHARSDSDEVARILAAEERFRTGEELLKKSEPAQARTAFAEAARLYPDEAEFHACLGWATWLASSRDVAGENQAQLHLTRALQLNPRIDRAYVFRGNIEKARGRIREAEGEFEKALLCNPACAEALRELKLARR